MPICTLPCSPRMPRCQYPHMVAPPPHTPKQEHTSHSKTQMPQSFGWLRQDPKNRGTLERCQHGSYPSFISCMGRQRLGVSDASLTHCCSGRCSAQIKPNPTLAWRGQLLLWKLPMANSSKVRVVEFLPRAFVTVRVTLYFTVEKSWRYLI